MYADTLNRVRVGNHNSEDLKFLSRRVCGSGHPVGPECSISQTATVLCSRHEQKDIINGQLLAELSTNTTAGYAQVSQTTVVLLYIFVKIIMADEVWIIENQSVIDLELS